MQCPSCESPTHVLESRRADGGAAVRRRRECPRCGERLTTYERRERSPLHVRKRDGAQQRFDRTKLRAGLLRAAHKRPVSADDVEAIVERIEAVAEGAGGEIEAQRVGELCLAGLRELDLGAYLQFAAVYRQLADREAIRAELARLEAPDSAAAERVVTGRDPVRFGARAAIGSVRPAREDSGSTSNAAHRRGSDD